MWTKEQLSSFTGEPAGTAMYLAIVGEVYDVSKGDKFYSAVGARLGVLVCCCCNLCMHQHLCMCGYVPSAAVWH
jgi:hypothetical protein